MQNKKLLVPIFIIVLVLQWYVPASMIIDREIVIRSGKTYKIRTAPIDPNDPFRGKYVSLNFRQNQYPASQALKKDLVAGDPLYLIPAIDKDGFLSIDTLLRTSPVHQKDYLEVSFAYFGENGQELIFQYPFDRFYMDEFKAPRAEQTYSSSMRDTSARTYALVRIWKGAGVVEDIMINDTSLTKLVKNE